jgi:tetratricopeptide (TPR) repeat protein
MKIQLYYFVVLLGLFSCSSNSHNREKAIAKQGEAANMYMHGILESNQDSIRKAISLLNESIALDSSYMFAYSTKAGILNDQGRYIESLAVLNLALRRQDDPYIFIQRGILNEKLNNMEAAKPDYKKAISLFDKMIAEDAHNFPALTNRAFALYLYENKELGIQALEKIRDKPLSEVEKKQLDALLKMLSELERDEIIKRIN